METAVLSSAAKTKPPRQGMISVPPFGNGSSSALFYTREHREEKLPKVNITFDGLGF